MSADEQKGLLMDVPTIRRELGVTDHVAGRILRWCAARRVVEDPEIRKTWVYREDVDAWVEQNTRSAA